MSPSELRRMMRNLGGVFINLLDARSRNWIPYRSRSIAKMTWLPIRCPRRSHSLYSCDCVAKTKSRARKQQGRILQRFLRSSWLKCRPAGFLRCPLERPAERLPSIYSDFQLLPPFPCLARITFIKSRVEWSLGSPAIATWPP